MSEASPAPGPEAAIAVGAALRWLAAGPSRTVVALVRHGEVENPAGIRYGRLPGFRLSDRGRAQAAAAAALLVPLAPVRALVASPLERTHETAAILAERLGAPVAFDDRLLEAESRFDGLARRRALHPRHLPAVWNPLAPSWAESFRAVAERTRAAILAAETAARGGTAIVVGHQSPIWLGLLAIEDGGPGWAAALRRAVPPWLRRPSRPGPGSVALLGFDEGRPELFSPPGRGWLGCP